MVKVSVFSLGQIASLIVAVYVPASRPVIITLYLLADSSSIEWFIGVKTSVVPFFNDNVYGSSIVDGIPPETMNSILPFAVGKLGDNTVSISARSKERVNVGEVMHELEGGGNPFSAATKLTETTTEEAGKRLLKTITPPFYTAK